MSVRLRRSGYLLLFSLLTLCSSSYGTPKPVRLQLKWAHQFQFAGYYAAIKKGYYKAEDLDVSLIEGTPANPPVKSVLDGKAEFGVSGGDIIGDRLNGKPIVLLSVIFQHSPYIILTLSKNKITTLTDLVGKRIMVSEDQGWMVLKSMFLREGIPIDSLHIVSQTWNDKDLISGKVDAMTAYSTVEPNRLQAQGYPVNIIAPEDYGIDLYGDVIFTTEKEVRDNPETVEAFNKASLKGWEYAMSHQEEIIDYILKLPGVKERGLTKGQLRLEARGMEDLILPRLIEIGHVNPGRWQRMLMLYKDLGLVNRNKNLQGFIYNPRHFRDEFFSMMIYFIAIAVVISLGALMWNTQLRKQVNIKAAALLKENQERSKAEERLELAIESANLSIWDWDTVTDELVFERKSSNILKNNQNIPRKMIEWNNLIHPDDKVRVSKASKDLLEGKLESNSVTYRIITSDNKWRWVLSFRKAASRDKTNRATRITGLHLDIDTMKNRELELNELSKELMKKNTELEKFAYITSHNLRAPVVNLQSLTDLYSQGDLDEASSADIFTKILQSVSRLDATLNDLIEIVSNKSAENVRKEEINLENEFLYIMQNIDDQIKDSGANIEFDFKEAAHVHFPKRYLQGILLNLLSNSLKYRSADRPLNVTVKSYSHKQFIVLTFTDNGLGIDLSRFKNKIFGLYQRFHPDIEGRGLGLFIVRSQMETMDGKVEIESTPGEGTTFKLSFYNPVKLT